MRSHDIERDGRKFCSLGSERLGPPARDSQQRAYWNSLALVANGRDLLSELRNMSSPHACQPDAELSQTLQTKNLPIPDFGSWQEKLA